ncbi:MAG: hypothetical protein ACRDKA_02200 [Actinomycetota bacterium]
MARGGGEAGWLRAGGLLGGAVLVVLALYLVLPVASGYRFPVGPDGPVYTWLARWASEVGFQDAPGGGPGVPALTLLLGRILGAGALEAVTLLGPVLAATCGLAAAALVHAAVGPGRLRVAAALLLTGAFTAYLAGGWLANVSMVTLFLSALAALAVAQRSWRAVAGAAVMLTAAGLAHRVFLLIGLVILTAVVIVRAPEAVSTIRGGRPFRDTSAARIAAAAFGGAGLALLGFASLGGSTVTGDTSQDGFLRRAGLRSLLLDRYRERFLGDLGRAAVPLTVGLGLGAAAFEMRPRPEGPGARFLMAVCGAWAVVTAVGVAALAITGWGPPNRLLQFAFFLPVAGALGVAALARTGRLGTAAGVLAGAALVGASMVGWLRQSPAVHAGELAAVAAAGRAVAGTPTDTPLVFLVDTDERAAAYHITRAGNVIRMGLPAERIDDVRLAVGKPDDLLEGRPTRTGDAEHDAASALYLRNAAPILDRATVVVLERFNAGGFERARELGPEAAPGVVILTGPSSPTSLGPPPAGVGPWALAGWSAAAVLVLAALGGGWARWSLPGCGAVAVLGAAPSVGIAAAILGALAADRAGIRPGGLGSLGVVLGFAAAGYLAAARPDRDRRERPLPTAPP